jgi:hypothetical protein
VSKETRCLPTPREVSTGSIVAFCRRRAETVFGPIVSIVTLVLSIGSIDEDDDVGVPTDLISDRFEGGGGGGGRGKLVLMDEDGDGTGDCRLPGVFNISIRLLIIKCSLNESV